MIDLSTDELLIAYRTLELLEPSEHLPENVLPAYLLLSEEHDELIDVPMLVALMFWDHVSMEVDKIVRLGTLLPFALVVGVQTSTVDASMEHIVLFLEKEFQLLHEELTS